MAIKFLLVFIMVFCISFAEVSVSTKRGITSEPIIFEVIVHEKCENYLTQALNSIQISKVNNPTCLPISPVNNAEDINDYHAHIFCTNIDHGRSLFRFHEIFQVSEDETPAPGAQFIVSWIVPHRFREAKNQYTYLRRPSCSILNDTCSTQQIVNDCWENPVDIDNTFVDSTDRVYLIPPGLTVGTCSLNGACCPYISLDSTGICGGIVQDLCRNVNCNDNNACTTDTCDPGTGTCSHVTTICNDNNPCTTDSCNTTSGSCIYDPVVCVGSNFCDVNGTCDTTNGNCVFQTRDCNDYDACTLNDVCDRTSQSCKHTGTPTCTRSDLCHFAFCDSTIGCTEVPLICSDSNTCTLDACVVQVIGGIPTAHCTYTDFCTTPVFCNVGTCTNQRCSPTGIGAPPCPPDNGTQTVQEYCTFSDSCPSGTICDVDNVCCLNTITRNCCNNFGFCRIIP